MKAKILGIVNITADSFSDGGRYLDSAAAIEHARKLLVDGADIIDLGAESTHPDAQRVPAEVEIARLTPVIAALKAEGAAVSVDTCKPAVMRGVLALGVDFINDVTALESDGAIKAVRDSSARLILMHALRQVVCVRAAADASEIEELSPAARTHPTSATPANDAVDGRAVRQEIPAENMLATVRDYFQGRIDALTAAGIARERLILDPGMGFFLSSQSEASLVVLRGLSELRSFGCPLLVCTSRKSFIGALLGGSRGPRPVAERGAGTLASELWAAVQGVAYIRTHDVRALHDGLRIWSAIQTSGSDAAPPTGAALADG